MEALEEPEAVRIYVGGLPQNPEPPLNYQIVYSLEGVLDYYTTKSWVLRDGEPFEVEALSEVAAVRFPDPIGELEAFHTAGGLSTMAQTYAGRSGTMEYKTLRYPGHADTMRTIRELGLLSSSRSRYGARWWCRATHSSPRWARVLRKPKAPDLVALRVEVEGRKGGEPVRVVCDLIDR